jgi:hypothetical protein
MKYLPLILLVLTIASCKNETTPTAAKPQPNTGNDTMVIAGKCAVLYSLPPGKLEQLKQKWGRQQYNAKIDSASYYTSEAVFHIDTARIKKIDATGKKVLKFVAAKQPDYIINLDTVQHLMGIYLFNPPKAPVEAEIPNAKNTIKQYYKP